MCVCARACMHACRYEEQTTREGSIHTSTVRVVNVSAALDYALFSCTARNSLGEDKLNIQLVSTSIASLYILNFVFVWLCLRLSEVLSTTSFLELLKKSYFPRTPVWKPHLSIVEKLHFSDNRVELSMVQIKHEKLVFSESNNPPLLFQRIT